MGRLYNKANEGEKRRDLRRDATPAEVLFWRQVRDRHLGGFKVRRQFGIAHYVADFCCTECKVIVELDGVSHEGEDAAEYDLKRQNYFEKLGFQVVRYRNEQVYKQMPDVLENLLTVLKGRRTGSH